MTNRYLLRWLQAALWLKAASVLLTASVLAALVWLLWLSPALQQSQQLAQQQQQQARSYQRLRQQLSSQPSLAATRAELEQRHATREAGEPFSLAILLNASGAVLEHWQPTPQGGELALRLQWPQVIRVLDYLSNLRPAVTVVQFALHREAQALALRLVLVTQDDTPAAGGGAE